MHLIFGKIFLLHHCIQLYGCQNCKVHYIEDIISGQPAKTVWKIMQMRALESALSRGLFHYSKHYSMSKFHHNH